MTPEEKENALRAKARRCAEEITKAMSVKPKPKWNAVCPPHPSQALREGPADGCQLSQICQCYWPHEWAVWSGIMSKNLHIELGDKYVVTGSTHDLILNEKRIIKDGKNAGQETLARLGYYSKFEHLVKELCHREILQSEAQSLQELRDYIVALGEKLSKAVES